MKTPRPHPGIPAETVGCALCRHTLEIILTDEIPALTHGRAVPAHPPVPVPMAEILAPHLLCDHCSAPHPVWSYRTAMIQAITIGETFRQVHDIGGGYAACQACADLIEAHDEAGLFARSLGAFIAISGTPPDAVTVDGLAALQRAFWDGLRRDRTRLHDGTPTPPPPIRAGALPKVRDRLRDWWTSDAPARTAWLQPGGRWGLPPHLAGWQAHIAALDASLERAAMYWIDAEFSALARHAAASLPELRIDRTQVPADDGLVVWAEALGDELALGAPVVAAHWMRVPDGWWIYFAAATGAHLSESALQTLRRAVGWLMPTGTGMFLPDDGAGHDPWLAVLVATWALIDQPLAVTAVTAADPALRRAYARTRRPDPQIRVVRVRPGSARDTAAPTTLPGRTYSHRWWVSGFWRQQAYGKQRALRRLIFIAGHLAGPADKPIQLRPTVHVLGQQKAAPPGDIDR